jgi:hypothetical protein
MKLAAGWIVGMFAGLASEAAISRAESSLDEYGAGAALRPAHQLVETACEVDVELRGAVATVELHQRI